MSYAQFKNYLHRRQPAAMLLVAFAVLLVMGVIYSLVVYQALRNQAESENLIANLAQAENGSHFIGDHQQGLLKRLSVIAGRTAFRKAVTGGDLAELNSFLTPLVGDRAEMDAAFVADAQGNLIVGLPKSELWDKVDHGLRPGITQKYISPRHPSPVTPGLDVVTLATPVLTPQGEAVGYLAVCQRTDKWKNTFSRLSARPGRSLALFDQNQNCLYTNIKPDDKSTFQLASKQQKQMRLAGRPLSRLARLENEQQDSFTASAPVPGTNWAVAVVQNYDLAMAPARLMFRNIIFFMGLLLVSLLFLGFLLLSRYRLQQRMLLELDEEARRLENLVQQRTSDLRQTTERFRNLIQNLPDVVYELDAGGKVTFISKAVGLVLGYEPGEMLGKPWRDFIAPQDREHYEDERQRAEAGDKLSIVALRHQTKDGEMRWLSIHSRALFDAGKNPVGRLGVARDVSSEVLAERTIRELSGRLINAQEEERKLIALDLHDEMGQILSALKIGLQTLANKDKGRREDIKEMIKLNQRVMDQIRALAYHLRPAILDSFGLVAALEDLCESMNDSKLLSVEYRFDTVDESVMPPQMRTSLFRFVQEALTNAMKHSGSLRVEVELVSNESEMVIRVRDWGKGFNVDQSLDVGKHLGLAGMRERISLVGGQLLIDSSPSGSILTVRVPLGGD